MNAVILISAVSVIYHYLKEPPGRVSYGCRHNNDGDDEDDDEIGGHGDGEALLNLKSEGRC